MVITKELEEEIKAFMDNYWNTYLEGDIQKWSTFITDDYKIVFRFDDDSKITSINIDFLVNIK